jgi:hypothetical protein
MTAPREPDRRGGDRTEERRTGEGTRRDEVGTERRAGAWRRAAATLRVVTVVVVTVLTLATAFVVTGSFGLAVAAECLAAVALAVALVITPRSTGEQPRRRAGAHAWLARLRFWGRARPGSPVRVSDFPAYAKISSDLGWAPVSQWHYDHGLRPLLARLAASALAEHHRVDAATDPARARRLVGDDVWPHLDPSRPPSYDSKTRGADLRTLTHIVDRLEQL